MNSIKPSFFTLVLYVLIAVSLVSGSAQTVKTINYNPTNGFVLAPATNQLTFTNAVSFDGSQIQFYWPYTEEGVTAPLFTGKPLWVTGGQNTVVTDSLQANFISVPGGFVAGGWGFVGASLLPSGLGSGNDTVIASISGTTLNFEYAPTFTNTAAQTRTNLGFTWNGLTNENATGFRSALQLSASWLTNTSAANFRTNLNLGLSALTNSNVSNFRTAIGLGWAALTNSNSVVTKLIGVNSNGIIQNTGLLLRADDLTIGLTYPNNPNGELLDSGRVLWANSSKTVSVGEDNFARVYFRNGISAGGDNIAGPNFTPQGIGNDNSGLMLAIDTYPDDGGWYMDFKVAPTFTNTAAQTRANLGFKASLNSLWTATNANVARVAVGLGATWLTNTSVTNFRAEIGLGLSALTNTNVSGFRSAILPSYAGNSNKVLALNSNGTEVIWTTNIGGGGASLSVPVSITNGGTAATNSDSARANLGIPSSFGSGTNSAVGGGINNLAKGDYSTVSGGFQNVVSNSYGVIAGGDKNTSSGFYSAVLGGSVNTAQGESSVVAGGVFNVASGAYAVVAGGLNNTAGPSSFAAGQGAYAGHFSSFVWADSTNILNVETFPSTNDNSFNVRARGGMSLDLGVNGISFRNPISAASTRTNLGLGAVSTGVTIGVAQVNIGTNGHGISSGTILGGETFLSLKAGELTKVRVTTNRVEFATPIGFDGSTNNADNIAATRLNLGLGSTNTPLFAGVSVQTVGTGIRQTGNDGILRFDAAGEERMRLTGGYRLELQGTNGHLAFATNNTNGPATTRVNLGLGNGITTNISVAIPGSTNQYRNLVFSNGILKEATIVSF